MPWWTSALTVVDDTLRGWSETLQKILRMVRLVRGLLVAAVVIVWLCAAGAIWRPEWVAYFAAGAIVVLSIPLIAFAVVASLPLKAKSAVRLIDQGYPANARELGIRLAARKLHDQSIETEELLVETAWNEGKKAYRRYKDRAEQVREDLDDIDDVEGEARGPSGKA